MPRHNRPIFAALVASGERMIRQASSMAEKQSLTLQQGQAV
jgi:hypothetical protein